MNQFVPFNKAYHQHASKSRLRASNNVPLMCEWKYTVSLSDPMCQFPREAAPSISTNHTCNGIPQPSKMAFPVLCGVLPDGKRSMTGWLSTWRVALPPLRVKRTTWYLPSFTVTAGSSMVMSSVPTLKITPTFPCSCVRMDSLFRGGH